MKNAGSVNSVPLNAGWCRKITTSWLLTEQDMKKKIKGQTELIIPKFRKYKPLKNKDIRTVRDDEWNIWYLTTFYFIKKKWNTPAWILNQRIKITHEMLRANNTKAKDAYMEQIREPIRRERKTTMWKMRSMHKQENTGMDIQTRQ